MICSGCDEPITADETVVHADEGQYHLGCEFEEVVCANCGEHVPESEAVAGPNGHAVHRDCTPHTGSEDEGKAKSVRPLTAAEWNGLLAETNYTLRISDGTKEGSWYFWCEEKHEGGEKWLHARRLIWYDDREVGTKQLSEALEGDVTTQLVVRND